MIFLKHLRQQMMSKPRQCDVMASELSNFLDMSDDLLTELLQMKDGIMKARDLPGTGMILDEDKYTR